MSFSFGNNSRKKLETCHSDLQKILNLAISRSSVDFGVSEGHRPKTVQFELFKIGRMIKNGKWIKIGKTVTNVDGYDKEGKHNIEISEAVDIYIYHPDKGVREKIMYSHIHMAYVIGIISSCAKELLVKGEITHDIRSGSNWDGDGIIDLDQTFDDYPHIELINL